MFVRIVIIAAVALFLVLWVRAVIDVFAAATCRQFGGPVGDLHADPAVHRPAGLHDVASVGRAIQRNTALAPAQQAAVEVAPHRVDCAHVTPCYVEAAHGVRERHGVRLPVELPRGHRRPTARPSSRDGARGDHAAYAALVRPHEQVAYRVAVAVTGWNAAAQEAVQNAHVNAYRSLHRFRRGASFRPWLLRIVVNEAHNVRRAERRHERLVSRAAEQHDVAGAGAEEAVIARDQATTVLVPLAAPGQRPRGARAPLLRPAPGPRGRQASRGFDGAYRVRLARARGGSSRGWRIWMTEHEFELRLLAAGRELDAEAPASPVRPPHATLPDPVRGRGLATAVALAAVAAAPAAVSALRDLFEVESVPELGPSQRTWHPRSSAGPPHRTRPAQLSRSRSRRFRRSARPTARTCATTSSARWSRSPSRAERSS